MHGGRLPTVAIAVLAAATAACGTGQPSASVGPAASSVADPACPQIALRSPNGEPVQLTGQWRGNNYDVYYLSQHGSCLYWVGQSWAEGDPPEGVFRVNVFTGRLDSDFMIHGHWSDVPVSSSFDSTRYGAMTLKVEFFDQRGTEWPTLSLLEPRGELFTAWNFVPEASLPERTEVVGTYGFDPPACTWIEVNGDRYEIELWSGQRPFAEGGQIFDEGGDVLARPGDRIAVEAQDAVSLSRFHCQPGYMLIWDLSLAP